MVEYGDGGRCYAPWCAGFERGNVGEVGEGLEAGAAYHCYPDWICWESACDLSDMGVLGGRKHTTVGVCYVGHFAEADVHAA